MNLFDAIAHAPLFSQPPLAIVVNVVVYLCFLVILFSVIADFVAYHRQDRGVVRGARSWVETGSMFGFLGVYYLAVRFGVLVVRVPAGWRVAMVAVGLLLMVAGAAFNVWGRLRLKSQWANQIRIYEGHELVTGGPFAVVRHPLYASLIWMFVGGSLVYSNVAALLLTLGVFVPMMVVRARKEDELLGEAFGERFEQYRARVGMLFPRPPR